MATAGALGFWLATAVVIPAFAVDGSFAYWTYNSLGPNLGAAVRSIVAHPIEVLRTLVTPVEKVHTYLWLFAPALFLSFGSIYLILAVPYLFERFLSDRAVLWGTEFQYSAVLAPILAEIIHDWNLDDEHGQPIPVTKNVNPGETFDFQVNLVAPVAPGTYQGFWNMRNAANDKFGETVWVGITVPGAATPTIAFMLAPST